MGLKIVWPNWKIHASLHQGAACHVLDMVPGTMVQSLVVTCLRCDHVRDSANARPACVMTTEQRESEVNGVLFIH